MIIGTAVECRICGLRKKPRGRSAPLEMENSLCSYDCPGYDQIPHIGQLWPGETSEQFPYVTAADGSDVVEKGDAK